MNHRKSILICSALLAIFTLSATSFIVVGTTQNEVYFNPQYSNAEFCNTTNVEIWVDAENIQSGQMNLTYDSDCVNVTNWERNTTNFPMGGWDSSTDGAEWLTFTALSPFTGEYHVGTLTIHCVCEEACTTTLDFTAPSALFDAYGAEITVNWIDGGFECTSSGDSFVFDTGSGTYPSISGTHNGTITSNQDISVSKLYTYPCTGTGGHTKYARIWNASWDGAEAHWNGYQGDWHNITFDESFTLRSGETYNYTIRTGSYPQIHHTPELATDNGTITCAGFADANGEKYCNWIPAIRLE